MNEPTQTVLDLLTVAALLFGLFFMAIGALGLWRLPDFFNRAHAATKCITLGISGMLVAAGLYLSTLPDANPLYILTTMTLVILFQFVAAPVGAHVLAKAAHLDRIETYRGTLGDELAEDEGE